MSSSMTKPTGPLWTTAVTNSTNLPEQRSIILNFKKFSNSPRSFLSFGKPEDEAA